MLDEFKCDLNCTPTNRGERAFIMSFMIKDIIFDENSRVQLKMCLFFIFIQQLPPVVNLVTLLISKQLMLDHPQGKNRLKLIDQSSLVFKSLNNLIFWLPSTVANPILFRSL